MSGEYLVSKENYEEMKKRADEAEKKIKHICSENPNCKRAEHCTSAIDVTTCADLGNGERRYIKGVGICESNCK